MEGETQMKDLQVSAKVPENKEKGIAAMEATVTVQCPEDLAEAEKAYGGDAVLSNAIANWKVTLQANIRGALKRGEAIESIATRLASAKMGVAQIGGQVDAEAAFKAKFLAATPEDRKKMIAQLRDLAAA